MAGEVTDFQKLYQFYETPPELARRMVALADVRDGQKVLEPSAGRGAILKAMPQTVHRTAVELNSSLVDLAAHAQRVLYGISCSAMGNWALSTASSPTPLPQRAGR